jgi:ATP-dependent exoDNAse (exonuclease V) alpha subunit
MQSIPARRIRLWSSGKMPTTSTLQLAELVDHVERRRAKLVLVGDDRQLSEIEAGGAFRALTRRLPAIELTENRRQAAAWERDALALLRDGDPRHALQLYEDHGRVVSGEHADEVRRRLVADWWTGRDADGALMIAFRRVDVADLNGRARALMRSSGCLGADELTLPGGAFSVGDRVLLRRNDRRVGVANGDRATVVAIDAERETVGLDVRGRHVTLDRGYLEQTSGRTGPSLTLGYAITGHSAQGLTCDRAFVLITSEASREWCYTALSRGRHANRLYAVVAEPDERLEYAPTQGRGRGRNVLTDAFGRSAAQTLASEVGRDGVQRRRAQGRDLFDRGTDLER